MRNFPFSSQQEQVNKFLVQNRQLGATMDSMQGTTRIIYDTQSFTSPSIITSYSFFSQLGGKQATSSFINNAPATNLTDNKFEPGEGMVVKEIYIFNVEQTQASNIANAYASLGLIDVVIGNNRVIKSLPLFTGGGHTTINNLNPTTNAKVSAVRLATNIVIPPQIQFFVNLTLPTAPATTASQGITLRVALRGYGKLFNPRNNY